MQGITDILQLSALSRIERDKPCLRSAMYSAACVSTLHGIWGCGAGRGYWHIKLAAGGGCYDSMWGRGVWWEEGGGAYQ